MLIYSGGHSRVVDGEALGFYDQCFNLPLEKFCSLRCG